MRISEETIIMVKDDVNLAPQLAQVLQSQGFTIVHAASMDWARELLPQYGRTFIIIDMPIQSLLVRQHVRKFCEQSGRYADILLLVDDHIDLSLDGLDIMVGEIMRKPVRDELLVAVVKRHIHNARLEQKLELYYKLATYDYLTDTYNRRFFDETLAREFSRSQRGAKPLSLLMADVDDFKRMNDIYGHRAGDHVLSAIARALKMSLRGMDIICRYGGEEFGMILPETTKEKACWVAERLRRIIAMKVICVPDRQPVSVTISLGVVTYPCDARDKETFLECADKALYCAKQRGKNRSCAWDPNLESTPDSLPLPTQKPA